MNTVFETIGYLASILIVISVMMKSFIRFRFINLIGSALFAVYGYLIGAYPVAVLNSFSAIANIYYIIKFRYHKDYFRLVPFEPESAFLAEFVAFYKVDILKYFPYFTVNPAEKLLCFYILRNMVPAGVFIVRRDTNTDAEVLLDYVTKEYRDFKTGNFLYKRNKKYFADLGLERFYIVKPTVDTHKYLTSMGYKEDDGVFTLDIIKNI